MADEAPKPKKKLPFKPTALRKNAARKASLPESSDGLGSDPIPGTTIANDEANGDGDDDDGLSLFRRAKEMERINAAERERKLLKKQRQQQLEEEERRMEEEEEEEERRQRQHTTSSHKRSWDEAKEQEELPRVDEDVADLRDGGSDAESFTTATSRPPSASKSSRRNSAQPSHLRGPVTPSPSKRSRRGSQSARTPTSSAARTSFNDDSTPPGLLASGSKPSTSFEMPPYPRTAVRPAPAQPRRVISLDSDDEDAEFPIVVSDLPVRSDDRDGVEVLGSTTTTTANARNAPPAAAAPEPEDEDDEFAEYVRKAEERRKRDLAQLGETGRDPGKASVDIYITSEVPECRGRECCVKFLYTRPLKLVRDVWLAQQLQKGAQIPHDQRDGVILTWRRKRVYNSSTLLSLGIRPQRDGRVAVDGYSTEGLGSQRTRVHMEAWTPDLFRRMQEEEEELRRRREAGEDDDDAADHDTEPEPEPVKLRVTLQARGMDEVPLTVRSETTVETLITGFRAQRGIEPDKDVGIWFDGERLEEHTTMAEAEVEDLDSLEVHIK